MIGEMNINQYYIYIYIYTSSKLHKFIVNKNLNILLQSLQQSWHSRSFRVQSGGGEVPLIRFHVFEVGLPIRKVVRRTHGIRDLRGPPMKWKRLM